MYKPLVFSFLTLVCMIAVFNARRLACGGTPDRGAEAIQRRKMVRDQIQRRGVSDSRVLEAMRAVPRHVFVPEAFRSAAYEDRPLPIAGGQTISQPYIVALMTELLGLTGHERVLEVGTGSGYQAAVLAELCRHVYTVEIIPELAEAAEKTLRQLGYTNISVRCADGYAGWPEEAPFDAIIVTCAPAAVPPALISQLRDGARLVVPVGETAQELKLVVKRGNTLQEKDIIPVRFVPMIRR